MKILSHGGGVQTRAMLRLALDGTIEKPDAVIFADTKAEPKEVYTAIQEDANECSKHNIPFHIVEYGDLSATDKWGGIFIPAHTVSAQGKNGMLRRQCTQRFKVAPIRKKLREMGATAKNPYEMWLGISTDEAVRMKDSNVKYAVHRWPLIEINWSREQCLNYLTNLGITPTKSACVFCPYHSASEWKRIKQNPEDWKAAVKYDQQIRNKRPQGGDLYVHPSRLPLDQAPIEDDRNQYTLWDNECEGHCGL